jgi:hypothetical protein
VSSIRSAGSGLSMSRKRKRHARTDKGYGCGECDAFFDLHSALKKHRKNVHVAEEQRPYPCTHCPKAFSYPKDLTRHVSHAHKDIAADGNMPASGLVESRASTSMDEETLPSDATNPPPNDPRPTTSGPVPDATESLDPELVRRITQQVTEQVIKNLQSADLAEHRPIGSA